MDRWEQLVAAVKSCVDQSLSPHEIVLVIDHNDELLERSVREITNANVVPNRSTKGLSGARNTGVAASTGDIVAFLDDDAYADTTWLENMSLPFRDHSVAGVGGWIIPQFEGNVPTWFPDTFYWILGCSYSGLPISGSAIRNPIGASMAMRRSVFSSVGGFTSGLGRIGTVPLGCEETEICIRYTAAHPDDRFVLQRDAVVHHLAPASRLNWHYFWTRCWAEGLSKAAVASLVGSSSGLSAERRQVLFAMPKELIENVRLARRDPKGAVIRSALVVAGTLCAGAGLLWGTLMLRRTPLVRGEVDMTLDGREPSGPTAPPR
jgi:cellulose synthase/poly-beta-1,6-N-acetylglucosamine synthase-like glycosyltransferase